MGEGGGSSDACRLRARGRQKHDVRTPPSRVSSILKGSFSKSVSTRRPAVPGFAARVPYIVGRAFTPAGEEVAAMGTGWALCRALPRSTRRCRKAPRRARSPALHCGRKRAATRKRQPFLKPDGGPMQASAPTQGAGGGREDAAARKGLAPVFRRVCGGRESVAIWKGICRARCGTPPSPAATPPLAGEAFGGAVPATAWGSCGRANFAGRCGHRVLCREGVGGKRKAPSAADAGRGGWGQKKRSPALKVSMGPDQRARTAAALSLV